MLRLLLLVGSLLPLRAAALSPAAPQRYDALGLPMDKARLSGFLQRFVSSGYDRGFRRLGEEQDFDHGHLLLAAETDAPVAILYHTQELKAVEGLDPGARSWLQWLDGRGVEDARRYERRAYPRSADWDWFVLRQLPGLRARSTVTDRMLDPGRLGTELGSSVQWTFTRTPCGAKAPDPASAVVRVSLPDGAPVCLALGS